MCNYLVTGFEVQDGIQVYTTQLIIGSAGYAESCQGAAILANKYLNGMERVVKVEEVRE